MKFEKILKITVFFVFMSVLAYANETKCTAKGNDYIYVENECLELAVVNAEDSESLNIILHGTWDRGTNTLGRYAPFVETLNLITDYTTVAISLPGYSNSTSNIFPALDNDKIKNLAAKKEYILFVSKAIEKLKQKYNAQKVNFIGHSAGAMIGSTILGLKPELIDNIALVGGRYNIHEVANNKELISAIDVIDNISKDTNILLIYGTKDKISKPEVTKEFYKIAKQKGLNVKLIEVKDGVHLDLDMTDSSVEAITELLDY